LIYAVDITTPKATLKTVPLVTKLKITYGMIYKFELEFPAGSAGLHYLRVLDSGRQIYPSTSEVWFHSDNRVISFDDTYLKNVEPYTIIIESYNLDDTYSHTVQLRLGFASKDIYMARFLPSYSWKYFKEMMQQLEVEQAAVIKERVEKGYNILKSEDK